MSVQELFPYLRVRDGEKAICFYAEAFGASEVFRLTEPGGRLGHAELKIGPGMLMLSEEFPEMGIVAPAPDAPAAITLHLHVGDADAIIARAVSLGAQIIRPAADHFYGERSGTICDPFGYLWSIGHLIERLSPDEMQRRYDALFATPAQAD
jgi:uncharacterized glyoxalase superfamily protein PhnB